MTGLDAGLLHAGGLFITGTDTAVGKTLAAAGLASTLRLAGLAPAAMKPVQTGLDDGNRDLDMIAQAGAIPPDKLAVPYSFCPAVSPKLAARISGRPIEIDKIIEEFERLKGLSAVVIVEGSGGLLAPISQESVMADLATALALPLLIVARPTLGTLNHTALTVEAARARKLKILGVVLSGFPRTPDLAEATNPAEIEVLTNCPIAGVIPKLGEDGSPVTVPDDPSAWYCPTLGGVFERQEFLESLKTRSATPVGAQVS